MQEHDDTFTPPPAGPVLLPEAGAGQELCAWAPDVVEAQALLLAELLGRHGQRVARELRRRARATLRGAWLAVAAARAELPEPRATWDCYRAGRDLERLIFETRRIPLPERAWMQNGRIFTLRRVRTVRIRGTIAWRLIRDVEVRFVEFGREGEPFRAWLWERVSKHLPDSDQRGPGAGMREDYELVYGRKRRDSE